MSRFKLLHQENGYKLYCDTKNMKIYLMDSEKNVVKKDSISLDEYNQVLQKQKKIQVQKRLNRMYKFNIGVLAVLCIYTFATIDYNKLSNMVKAIKTKQNIENDNMDYLIDNLYAMIDNNEAYTIYQKEYLKNVYNKIYSKCGYLLDIDTIFGMYNRIEDVNIEYKTNKDDLKFASYFPEENKIEIYNNNSIFSKNDKDKEGYTLDDFVHENNHCLNWNYKTSEQFDQNSHAFLREALASSLSSYGIGIDMQTYKNFNEYALIISQIIGKEKLLEYLLNSEYKNITKEIAKECQVEEQEIESLFYVITEVLYNTDTEYSESNVRKKLVDLVLKSQNKTNETDFILENFLNSKFELKTPFFLDELTYDSKLDIPGKFKISINEKNRYQYISDILEQNAESYLKDLCIKYQNQTINETEEIILNEFLSLCTEEELYLIQAVNFEDNFYKLIKNKLSNYGASPIYCNIFILQTANLDYYGIEELQSAILNSLNYSDLSTYEGIANLKKLEEDYKKLDIMLNSSEDTSLANKFTKEISYKYDSLNIDYIYKLLYTCSNLEYQHKALFKPLNIQMDNCIEPENTETIITKEDEIVIYVKVFPESITLNNQQYACYELSDFSTNKLILNWDGSGEKTYVNVTEIEKDGIFKKVVLFSLNNDNHNNLSNLGTIEIPLKNYTQTTALKVYKNEDK